MTILLKNGTVLDYASNTNDRLDILIEDDKIKEIAKDISIEVDKTVNCNGLYIMPGIIDIHCHLREPGFEHKETIETGSKSAVKGGFTTICPMPNTKPTPDNVKTLKWIIEKGKEIGLCNILPYASVTKGEKGEELVDFEELLEAGAIGFSDDGMPVENARMIRDAIIKANEIGSFVAEHCEEKAVAEYPEAEEIMAARDIVIAETNNLKTHICHISTETSVNMIRDAKKRGVKVSSETCPHYYSFINEEILASGANAKMNPPLRTKKDMEAIIKGLQDGTIDCIITDHAPHSKEEKEKEFSKTPNGIIGFETALSATITNLVDKGYISYIDMVRLMSYNPAKIINIDRGEIKQGAIADLTIFNPDIEYVYTEDSIVSKSKNTPWIGKKLKGKVIYTIVNGKVVYEEENKNECNR